ncbi:MAG: tetratricopeptide repeat protein [Euryarchaeota archaeon]|nr:tetratricopeptide repeat protein [Euryarchaeota archaeon]
MPLFGGKKETGKDTGKKKTKAVAQIDEIISEADKFLKNGDIDNAAKEYNRAYRYLASEEKLSETPQDSSRLYAAVGQGYFEVDEIDRSIECFDKATQFDKANVDAWLSKGIAHLKTKQLLNFAVLCFNEVLKLKPDNSEALEYKAEALTLDGKKDEAVECYRKLSELFPDNKKYAAKVDELAPASVEALTAALAKNPNNLDALTKKADLLSRKGDSSGAAELYVKVGRLKKDASWYEKALSLQPSNVDALNALLEQSPKNMDYLSRKAEVLKGKGRISDAIDIYFRMGEVEPQNPAHFERILALNPRNLTAMDRILQIQPHNLAIRARRASELVVYGRKEEALAEYQELAKLDPANQEHAAKLRELQPDEMAVIDAELAKRPNDEGLLAKKAGLLEAKGEKAGAIKLWRTLYAKAPAKLEYIDALLKFLPDDIALLTSKGDAAYEQGNLAKALEAFEKLSALTPSDENVWHNKGATLYQLKRFEDAVACFDRLLSFSQDDTVAWLTKGVSLYKLGRWDDAIAALNNVVKRDMNEAAAWYYKACSEAKKGNAKLVIPFLKRAVEIDASYKETAKEEEAFAAAKGTPEFAALVG